MPTTTPSSEPGRARILACGVAALALGACQSAVPDREIFVLEPESPAHRAEETRCFETRDSMELVSASAAVLQDLGFCVEESVRELGFLRASKERSAREYGQEIGRAFLLILSMGKFLEPIDLHQRIAATLVARPADPQGKRQEVRISFYRVVWAGAGVADRQAIPPGAQKMERVRDPVIYRQFFSKLSKAVFLEAYAP